MFLTNLLFFSFLDFAGVDGCVLPAWGEVLGEGFQSRSVDPWCLFCWLFSLILRFCHCCRNFLQRLWLIPTFPLIQWYVQTIFTRLVYEANYDDLYCPLTWCKTQWEHHASALWLESYAAWTSAQKRGRERSNLFCTGLSAALSNPKC